jgi:hypothetical protein
MVCSAAQKLASQTGSVALNPLLLLLLLALALL